MQNVQGFVMKVQTKKEIMQRFLVQQCYNGNINW